LVFKEKHKKKPAGTAKNMACIFYQEGMDEKRRKEE
jgi:hypothetical protein